jgi:hypothetical protein
MDEDTIADLKQFIAATVKQATADLATKDEMDVRFAKVDARFDDMDKRFDELNLKVDTIADAQAETLEDHEQRIPRLEPRTA